MSRLKAVLEPAPAAGRRLRLSVLGVAALILGLAGGGAFAVAGQRSPQLVSADEAAGLPITARETVWLNAALDPIYKAAWPKACGYGSTSDGAVFVQIGKGCTTDDVADPVIESIAFVDPSRSPRDAFAAVKAACDAGLEVPIRFRQAGVRAQTSVRCAAPAVLPPEPTAFEIRLTWRGVTPEPGDRLVVSLERKVGETTFRRSLDFGLADSALPSSVKAMVQPEYFFGQRSPTMKAALVGRDGRVRAVSGDRELPMLVRDTEAVGYAVLTPATDAPQAAASEAGQTSVRAALASLTPEQRARYANPTGEQYKALCRSAEVGDEGFCSGVLFAQLPDRSNQQAGICAPTRADDYDVTRIAREGRRAVASVRLSPGMAATDVAREALKAAFPCPTTAARGASMRVSLERSGNPVAVGPGETIVVQLTNETGMPVTSAVADRAALRDGAVGMGLEDRYFPGFGQAPRVYTLTGALYGADGSVISRAQPVTVRLAPMSRLNANLRPTLAFPT